LIYRFQDFYTQKPYKYVQKLKRREKDFLRNLHNLKAGLAKNTRYNAVLKQKLQLFATGKGIHKN